MNAHIIPLALYQEVAERLRQRIFANKLPPGSWIDEQSLAEEYGISRTPLREALKVLASEGLVTLRPRRGCYVTEISEADLNHIFPLLGLLEGHAIVEAMRHAKSDDIDELESLHDKLERAARDDKTQRFFDTNQEFHKKIHELSGNRWLMMMIQDLRKVMRLSRQMSLTREGRLQQSLDEHRQIMAAIRKNDPKEAETLMRNHFQSCLTVLAPGSQPSAQSE